MGGISQSHAGDWFNAVVVRILDYQRCKTAENVSLESYDCLHNGINSRQKDVQYFYHKMGEHYENSLWDEKLC